MHYHAPYPRFPREWSSRFIYPGEHIPIFFMGLQKKSWNTFYAEPWDAGDNLNGAFSLLSVQILYWNSLQLLRKWHSSCQATGEVQAGCAYTLNTDTLLILLCGSIIKAHFYVHLQAILQKWAISTVLWHLLSVLIFWCSSCQPIRFRNTIGVSTDLVKCESCIELF
jgi:hypothetical protein